MEGGKDLSSLGWPREEGKSFVLKEARRQTRNRTKSPFQRRQERLFPGRRQSYFGLHCKTGSRGRHANFIEALCGEPRGQIVSACGAPAYRP